METKRFVVAFLAAMAVFFLSTTLINLLLPKPPAPASQPAAQGGAPSAPAAQAPLPGASQPSSAGQAPEFAAGSAPALVVRGGDSTLPFTLGGAEKDALELRIDPRGGCISKLLLTGRDARGRLMEAATPGGEEPYTVLRPLHNNLRELGSYETIGLRIGSATHPLHDTLWRVLEQDQEHVTLGLQVEGGEVGGNGIEVRKTYRLRADKPLLRLELEVRNQGDRPADISLQQAGPIGIPRENPQYDMRRLVWADRPAPAENPGAPGEIKISSVTRSSLTSERKLGSSAPAEAFLWAALGNRYFTVVTRPLPAAGQELPDYLDSVAAFQAAPANAQEQGDMAVRFATKATRIAPGAAVGYAFEIYAGTKSGDALAATDPAFADRTALGYIAIHDFDKRSCFCSFLFLNDFMSWLLDVIYAVVRNYGVAIIILVVIVRTLLHPLAVFQQKSMYKMQEVQVRLGPKMAAIKEQYKGDAVAINRETMKLYAEENVNPAAQLVSMVPMFIQMPILIALWTALNTNVHLRHAGFDGWWIRDLSNPDGLIRFGPAGFTIPLLGQLIPSFFANIPSFNLLPILMGVSMYLQQKYMPKPSQLAKGGAAQQNPNQKNALGMTAEDQMRQQQMMGVMMSVMMPLMFYYMPSGLNLYWLSTNVFGIFESLRIRKQIEAEKERRAREPQLARAAPKPSAISRFLRSIAEQVEEAQKKADSVRADDTRSSKRQRREKKARS